MLTKTHRNLNIKPWLYEEFLNIVKESFIEFHIELKDQDIILKNFKELQKFIVIWYNLNMLVLQILIASAINFTTNRSFIIEFDTVQEYGYHILETEFDTTLATTSDTSKDYYIWAIIPSNFKVPTSYSICQVSITSSSGPWTDSTCVNSG